MPMSAPWLHKHCPGVFTSEGAAKNLMVKSVSAWKTTKDQKSISILYWGSDPLWDFKELAPGTNGLATWHLFTYYRGSYRGGRPSHAFVEDGYDPAKAIQETLGTSDEMPTPPTPGVRPLMSDTPNLVLPFVVWPGASSAERTQLLELWANVILKAGWEAASAAAPQPFRLVWHRSARGNWWARHKDWHVVVFRRDDGMWATRMQQDGRPPRYLKATTQDASWAMEGLDTSFGKRFA